MLTVGIFEGINAVNAANATNTANAADSATTLNTVNTGVNQSTTLSADFTQFGSGTTEVANTGSNFVSATNTVNTANNLTLTDRVITALKNSAIQSTSQAAAQSAINGDNFQDALKLQAKYFLISAVGEVGANEIGAAAHTNQITTAEQLTLHAGLGCAMGQALNQNCAGGDAVS